MSPQEGAGTIIDILGDDAEICVEFTSGSITGQRDCKFSDELWETYGEKFHYHQVIRVFGVTSSLKEPITVLEIGFPDEQSEFELVRFENQPTESPKSAKN